jgi:hypothetical protein
VSHWTQALAVAVAVAPAEDPSPERPTIVVSIDGHTEDLLAAAVRAIEAHAQGVSLVVERSRLPGADLRAHMREAERLAQLHGATGVFWLDLQSEDEFLLYLFEPEGLRVLVRRIPTSAADRPAAIESVGVIVGSSSEALASGETIGMTPVDPALTREPEPESAPTPVPPPVEPRPPPAPAPRLWKHLRISLAYAGTTYARNMPWQQGGALAVAAAVAPRLHVGVEYSLLAPDRIREPIPLELWRHPIAAHVGFQQTLVRWLALDGQLAAGLTIDDWRRLDAQRSGLRAVGTVAPWTFLRVFLGGGFSLDVGVGAEFMLGSWRYTWQCEEQRECVAVRPDVVRGRVRGGISYTF